MNKSTIIILYSFVKIWLRRHIRHRSLPKPILCPAHKLLWQAQEGSNFYIETEKSHVLFRFRRWARWWQEPELEPVHIMVSDKIPPMLTIACRVLWWGGEAMLLRCLLRGGVTDRCPRLARRPPHRPAIRNFRIAQTVWQRRQDSNRAFQG